MAVDDSFTVCLLHFDGSDTSTTFTDESGKTWTARGNAQIDTAQQVFGTASGLFDGTGDYIDTPDHADWQLDGGADSNAFTIDLRIRFNGDPGTGSMTLVSQYGNANNYWLIRLSNNTLQILYNQAGTFVVNISNAWNPATATWYHVAWVKNGATGHLMFIDGTQIGTTQTDTSTMQDLAAVLQVAAFNGGQAFNGWLDEVRVSKGVARWTTNFTPPTSAYAPSGFTPRAILI